MKKIKTYKVKLGEEVKGIEYFNVDNKTVLAETVTEAMEVAIDLLSKVDKKTAFVESVELVAVIN